MRSKKTHVKDVFDRYLKKALPGDDRTRAMIEHAYWFGATAAYNALSNGIGSGPQVGSITMHDMEAELKAWNRDENVAAVCKRALGIETIQ